MARLAPWLIRPCERIWERAGGRFAADAVETAENTAIVAVECE